jgi:uncharacterized protein (DUF433 family)
MDHQNFQEAIAQLSTSEGLNPEEIKNRFNLNEEDIKAMKSYNPSIQAMTPRPTVLCCCCV